MLLRGKKFPFIRYNFSKVRINIIVILDVIFVVRGRDKKRIEIDYINSQALQIVHFVQHALKVSAVKFTDAQNCRDLVPVVDMDGFVAYIFIFACKHIIRGISVIKTVYIDLVHNGSLGPLWSLKAGNHAKGIFRYGLFHHASGIIKIAILFRMDFEVVRKLFVFHLHYTIEVIKVTFCLL